MFILCVSEGRERRRKVFESDGQLFNRAIVLKREQFNLYVLQGRARLNE